MGGWLKYATSGTLKLGPFVSTDGVSDATGLTINDTDVRISKNGANIAAKGDTQNCSHDEIGVYDCPISTGDAGTLGVLDIYVNVSGALPYFDRYQVIAANVYDSFCGSTYLKTNIAEINSNTVQSTSGYLQVEVNTKTGFGVSSIESTEKANIVDQVWDEAVSGHTGTGTFGGKNQKVVPSTAVNDYKADVSSKAETTDVTALNDIASTDVNAQVDQALVDIGLDHLVSAAVAGTDIADDSIIAQMVSKTTTADWDSYDNAADSLEAVRDRGDAAWITGGGGSISDILNPRPLIPNTIDVANGITIRVGVGLTNAVDDLPTTAEITPGVLDIDVKAMGTTAWTNIVSSGACSEDDGIIYYDEVFDTGSGYAAGQTVRFTFRGQKITVAANDYNITSTDIGWRFQTHLRQAMRGTDSAYTGTPPTVGQIADQVWDEAVSGHTGTGSFGGKNQNIVPSTALGDYKADVTGVTVASINSTAKTGFVLASTGLRGITIGGTTVTMEDALHAAAALAAAKTSGGGTASLTIRNLGDSRDMITITATTIGNRTGVTLNFNT